MADFWIKIEKGTPDKPEILEMAAILGIEDPDTIVGKLIRVWSWFDSNSKDGHAPIVTRVLLDRLTGTQGFVETMVAVGWLEENDDGYFMTNHERHHGKSAKKRALDAERKRVSRTKADKSVTRVEKSRVEKKKKTPVKKKTEAASSDAEFDKFWNTYDKKTGLKKVKAKWARLTKGEIKSIFSVLTDYVKSKPDRQYRMNPLTWLNGECWDDEIEFKASDVAPTPQPKTDKQRKEEADKIWQDLGFKTEKEYRAHEHKIAMKRLDDLRK